VVLLLAAAVLVVLFVAGVIGGGSDKTEPEPTVTVTPNPTAAPDEMREPEETPTPAPEPADTPEPEETPTPEISNNYDDLTGRWELESGVLLFFFGKSEYIDFISFGDGTGSVFESEQEEAGVWHIDEDGSFIVEAEWSGSYEFLLILSGDTLIIIDSDGDSSKYVRAD